MNDIHFYTAYVSVNINNPLEFRLKEAEIEEIHDDGTIELLHYYHYGEDVLSCLFGGSSGYELDKEFHLFDWTAYYSTDENKCIDFILRKIKERNELIRKSKKE